MVKNAPKQNGFTVVELMVAMAILVLAMMPLAYSFTQEQKILRNSYRRAVAIELVDGEMEILLAGEWRAFSPGEQPYTFHAASAANLPPGKVTLTITGKHLRLDWKPDQKSSGGEVVRDADTK
jgi:prepilin-type N-terminal cleavage/methylation domain-containing protein